MQSAGESKKGEIRPEFAPSLRIDFRGTRITSDVGVLMLREVDERSGIIGSMEDSINDFRSTKHKGEQEHAPLGQDQLQQFWCKPCPFEDGSSGLQSSSHDSHVLLFR
jgi:hypothetical protein